MKKTKVSANKKYYVVGIIAAVAVAGFMLYKSMVQTTTINMIGRPAESELAKPMPSIAPRACETVTTFTLSGSCGNNSYQTVSFNCGTTKGVIKQGNTSTCKSVSTWYSEAIATCLNSCPKESPVPSGCYYTQPKCIKAPCKLDRVLVCPKPSPSIMPSPIPSPIVCKFEMGSCMGIKRGCESYKDTCTKSEVCATPFQPCGQASVPPKESVRPTAYPTTLPDSTVAPAPTTVPSN